jgi:Rha family phage regulatory protein
MSDVASDLFPSEPERQPVLNVKNGEVFASSRDVAESFGRNHRDVTRAIDVLVEHEPSLRLRTFTQTQIERITPTGGAVLDRAFEMTRDGFTLLAMGFTGAKALKWKLRYIEAFNRMEAELRDRPADPMAVLNNPAQLRNLLLTYSEKVTTLESQNAAMVPKVAALNRIAELDGSFCVRDAAKNLQIPENILWRYLRSNGWVYRRPGSPGEIGYSTHLANGDLTHKVMEYQRPDGTTSSRTQVRITPKGLTVLAQAFPPKARLV